MDDKTRFYRINQMLDLIMEPSHQMPNHVFRYYVDLNKKSEEKIVYNLIADSFLTLFSYCKLIREGAWSQAFALLRVGIEQIAAVFVLTHNSHAVEEYLRIHKLEGEYLMCVSKEDKKKYLSQYGIKGRASDFFDYGWIMNLREDHTYGRNQLIEMARLGEFRIDIEETLNAFSHGSLSVFQMDGDNWNVMKKYGRRASLICCKLYDFLCCSYHCLIGKDEFSKLPISGAFEMFKAAYHKYFVDEGWIKAI